MEFRAKPNPEEVITAIRQAVTEVHEIEVYGVVLIKPGRIPKTSSGKIQRRATRQQFLEGTLKTVASNILKSVGLAREATKLERSQLLELPPREGQALLESYLIDRQAQILGIASNDINPEEPLTTLGLDSLKVFELKNQIEVDLEVEVSVADFFEGMSTRSLSTKILAQLETDITTKSTSPQKVITNDNVHPVSSAQARLWFLDRLKTGNPAYNISFAVNIKGQLSIARLKDSIDRVISRQKILSTSFAVAEGKPVQLVHPSFKVALPVVDVDSTQLKKITTEEHQKPFNIAEVPLLRCKLLRLNSEEHVLLLTMHHIIADGLSAEVFMTEVAQSYRGLTLPDLPLQYQDFVYWQLQELEQDSHRHLDYWQDKLKAAPPLLKLPTDKPRPTVQSYQGKSQSWEIPASLSQELQNLAIKEGVTLFMLLLTAFKTLLYRYTGQEDILVGSPIANRNHDRLKGLIGFFVNTVVLRSDLTGDPSFLDLLSQVRQVAIEAYAHQDLPFDKLVEALQPERDLSYTPLFQVMFAMQNAPQLAEIPNLTLKEYKVNPEIAQFDLSVCVEYVDERLIATFEYDRDLFEDQTIARMVDHYQNLLSGIVTNPNRQLSDLPLLSDRERQQVLVDWNPDLTDYCEDFSIQNLFETQVEKNAQKIALVDGDRQLTYQELNSRANGLADYLKSIEIKPGIFVGVYLKRSWETIVAILAVIKAGAAYLPLDPEYPPERIAEILEDAQPLVILSNEQLQTQLPVSSAKVVCLDWEEINLSCQENPAIISAKDDAIYVIYTSGSTGKPKGVICTYSGLLNTYLAWQQAELIPVSDRNCFLQMASFSFDVFTGDVIKALCSGAKLVICPQKLLLEPKKLYQFMVREKVNCADFVPAVLMNLVCYLEQTEQYLDFMELLIVGSDAWYLKDYHRIKKVCNSNTKIINAYGVTEGTIDSTYFELENLHLSRDRLVPIGRPFANSQVYLLDKHLQPVPVGIWGEIYLGGTSLARGYLNRPELTQKKFIANPWHNNFPKHSPKLYQTGDIARYLPNGNLEFSGRIDNQVKIRGFRIEIAEIEAIIAKHSDVKQGAVIVQKDASGKVFLKAYLVAKETKENNLEKLISSVKKHLQQHLLEYTIPNDWQVLAELPLTANGKCDRQILSKLKTPNKVVININSVLPNSKHEQIIAQVLQEILQRDNINVNDNFFDVGGHSLLLAQVQEKLEQSLAINLAITDLFKYPSIRSLANHLSQKSKNNQLPARVNRIERQKAALSRQKNLRKIKK